jgi:hypothetical protein
VAEEPHSASNFRAQLGDVVLKPQQGRGRRNVLFPNIIRPLRKSSGDRVQRLQVRSGSESGEDAPQTEPWATDHEN